MAWSLSAPVPSPAPARQALSDPAFLRKLEQLALNARRIARGAGRGERKTGRTGAGLEFADHREYAPGDDLRRIDWNLFGRMERPMVRLFEAEEELPVYVLLDRSASMGIGSPPKLALAAQVTAALAYLATSAREPVQVWGFAQALDDGMTPARGGTGFRRFLDQLGGVLPAGQTALDTAASHLLAHRRRRGLVVLVSDFFGAGGEAALDRLRHARYEPAVVAITAAEDRRAPEDDDIQIVDAETGVERSVRLTAQARLEFERAVLARAAGLARFCHRRGIPSVAASAEQPFDDVVLRLLRVSGVVG